MRKHYQYILVFLSLVIVYELYLIFSFKYLDIQKDIAIDQVQNSLSKLKTDISVKKEYFAYINTIAYKDKIAKSSQNKINPGEEVIYIVSKEDTEQYKKIDVDKQIYSENAIKNPTYGMSNWQKWVYYIFKVDIRE